MLLRAPLLATLGILPTTEAAPKPNVIFVLAGESALLSLFSPAAP